MDLVIHGLPSQEPYRSQVLNINGAFDRTGSGDDGQSDATKRFSAGDCLSYAGQAIYWGFLGLEPPESETIAREFARVSGYTSVRYVDSYAGYKDWFIQDWRRPGFTVETGRGVNPLPLDQFDEIYEQSLGILLANLYL